MWWNVCLTDDPAAWDDTMLRLNACQQALGALPDGVRLVRAHMAQFCRRQPLFPASIELLLSEIGACKPVRHILVGCEGRGLLRGEGWYTPEAISEGHEAICRLYGQALNRWLANEPVTTAFDAKIAGFLHHHGSRSTEGARRVLELLADGVPSLVDTVQVTRALCVASHGALELESAPVYPFACFHCQTVTQATEHDQTGCSLGALIDAALLCAGAEPGELLGALAWHLRCWQQELTLAYAAAVNVWLMAWPAPPFVWPEAAKFIDGERARAIILQTAIALGERTPQKEWLAACLLRTLAGNKRLLGRAELLDSFPMATSWLWPEKEHDAHD